MFRKKDGKPTKPRRIFLFFPGNVFFFIKKSLKKANKREYYVPWQDDVMIKKEQIENRLKIR